MNSTLLLVSASFLLTSSFGYAGSAAWKPHPTSGDWNNAANWKPGTIPNGPDDIATFPVSATTDVSLSAVETEVDGIVFTSGASAFTITPANSNTLAITGFGIVNNSGVAQNFVTTTASVNSGLSFHNQATAGSLTVFTLSNYGVSFGELSFYDEASAAFGTFIIEGTKYFEDGSPMLAFFQNSTAANGIFINTGAAGYEGQGGETSFFDNSTAANGTFTNKGDTAQFGYFGAATGFHDNSTAADSIITNEGTTASGENGGYTAFLDNATAGNAIITCLGATYDFASAGQLKFYGNSSAGNATLTANGGSNGGFGGQIQFFETSDGGTARVKLFGTGTLDLSGLPPESVRISIGSLEGDGFVSLGLQFHNLNVGTNNLSTVFSGLIQGSGSLSKVGSGTLTLTGANTYTGSTSVSNGFLRVENRTGSATGSGRVTVYTTATLGGGGIITGHLQLEGGTLAPGTGATTLTVTKTLSLHGVPTTYLWRVKTTSRKSDKVIAGFVNLYNDPTFSGNAVGNATLPAGTVFTAIDNTSSDPINGTFGNLPDGGTISIGRNTYQANYEGGDGNDLTLTVVSN